MFLLRRKSGWRLWSFAGLVSLLCAAASSQPQQPLDVLYRDTAGRLIGSALVNDAGWAKLEYLCDRIGNRLSGSESLQRAVAWTAEQMKKDGLENVVAPAVTVPHWERGRESAALVTPIRKPLAMLGLGGSVGTPPGGITAAVVVVRSFEELEGKGRAGVAGKIVLYNEPNLGYNRTVIYRSQGASRAAKLGAVAALVRSVDTAVTLQTVHTGAMNYAADAPQIPAAAVSVEDTLLVQRLFDSGDPVTIHLEMEARTPRPV
jgi:carboxypeptidase Q